MVLRLVALVLVLTLGQGLPSVAAAEPEGNTSHPLVQGRPLGDSLRLAPYEDNYVIWRTASNPGWTGPDERALRARLSFKYTFCGPQFDPSGAVELPPGLAEPRHSVCPDWLDKVEFFFAYTGEFDFYAGTRSSGPVIGRVNAPGLFLRWPTQSLFGLGSSHTDAVEFGIQHRSNGQATEVVDPRFAEEQYAIGNRAYFDTVSRSSNFLVLATDLEYRPPVGQRLRLRAKLRHYLRSGEESAVTWGPLANRGRRFADYDRLNLHAWWQLGDAHTLDLLWRVGDRGFETDSWTLGWEWKLWGLPLYLRYHRGPMNTLSNYTQRQDSIGLGLRFSGY